VAERAQRAASEERMQME